MTDGRQGEQTLWRGGSKSDEIPLAAPQRTNGTKRPRDPRIAPAPATAAPDLLDICDVSVAIISVGPAGTAA